MPATEQTWRDSKTLHGVFMASSVALLVSTMWMFYADHNREWKKFNDTARSLDLTTNKWARNQYETDQKNHEHEHLKVALKKARLRGDQRRLFGRVPGKERQERQHQIPCHEVEWRPA